MDEVTPKVLNTHWYGGIEKLPETCVYIGRPSPYGNAYTSKSGLYTKEECVALHKVDLYCRCIDHPSYLPRLRQDLYQKDVACWCKHPKRIVGCHGDNYLHLLSNRLQHRVYDKNVLHYVMDDLRFLLAAFRDRIRLKETLKEYLFLYIHLEDIRIDLQDAITFCKEKKIASEQICFFIAQVVVDLDLAYQDHDIQMITYRFHHVLWRIHQFVKERDDRYGEPVSPHLPLKRPVKL